MKSVELLAPAGNFECLEAACQHGADAVYIGLSRFNLRAHSNNFEVDELTEALAVARRYHAKLYIVLNCMPDDAMLAEMKLLMKKISHFDCLPDACIVSDPGVLSLCKEYLPTIAVHLSTQTGTFNSAAVRFWADQGIGRVILPRELTLEQIRLCANTTCGCETEVFIHGAMCVSISGRCLLGAYLSSRHANHGDCPQPCRLAYEIKPLYSGSEAKDIRFTAQEDENGVFLLNSKDLNAVAILPALIATGVTALKIEGRNKSINYISTVVKVYRQAIDRCLQEGGTYAPLSAWIDQLNTIEHRPYTEGFYGGEYQLQAYEGPKSASPLRVVGILKGCGPHGQSLIDVKNPFLTGDVLSVLPISKNIESFNVTVTSINDYAGNSCHRALTNRIVVIQTAPRLSIGDILRKEVVQCKTGQSAV